MKQKPKFDEFTEAWFGKLVEFKLPDKTGKGLHEELECRNPMCESRSLDKSTECGKVWV